MNICPWQQLFFPRATPHPRHNQAKQIGSPYAFLWSRSCIVSVLCIISISWIIYAPCNSRIERLNPKQYTRQISNVNNSALSTRALPTIFQSGRRGYRRNCSLKSPLFGFLLTQVHPNNICNVPSNLVHEIMAYLYAHLHHSNILSSTVWIIRMGIKIL